MKIDADFSVDVYADGFDNIQLYPYCNIRLEHLPQDIQQRIKELAREGYNNFSIDFGKMVVFQSEFTITDDMDEDDDDYYEDEDEDVVNIII